jgi:hypothetical protein
MLFAMKRREPKSLPRGIQQPTSISSMQKLGFICWSALNLFAALFLGLCFGAGLMLGYQSDFTEGTAMGEVPDLTKSDVLHRVGAQTLNSCLWLAFPVLLLWCINYFVYTNELRIFRNAGFWVSLSGTFLMFVGVGLANWDALASYP